MAATIGGHLQLDGFFNIETGSRQKETHLPPWTASVAKLDETLLIPDINNETPGEEERSPHFLNMNIIAAAPHVLFV